jgi:Protein of unknown function (DUF4012)
VGFLNEAESRGLGGIPGAFAILTADHGRLRFTSFHSDSELFRASSGVDLGSDFDARYAAADPANTFPNSDISPNFPDAARIWAGMWEQKTGKHITAALALDPTALAYLLDVTGPATLHDGSLVSADNVVALTQRDQYAAFSSNAARKRYVVAVSKAVAEKLLQAQWNADMIKAASRASRERRFVVWSADNPVERDIDHGGYGGTLGERDAPYSGFTVVNAAGNKLDYYLKRSMTYRRAGCGVGSQSVATLTLTNTAPATGLPRYVTVRADSAPPDTKPGDNRLIVTYYATAGSRVSRTAVDGQPIVLASIPERGLVTVTTTIELPVGASRTITVHVDEPPSTEDVQILRQPGVQPLGVTVTNPRC